MVITSAFEAEILGSIPGETFAALAQSVERAPFKRVAVGSIPTGGKPFVSRHYLFLDFAWLAERSKALSSSDSLFGVVGSNPSSCINLHTIV